MSIFALPLARILLSLVFIFTGYAKVFGYCCKADGTSVIDMTLWKQRVGGLKFPGSDNPLPSPDLLAQIVAYGEIVGGIMLFLGILSRLSAFGLLIFAIIATVLGHAFWTFADAQQAYLQIGQFLKNMGIIGGLLLIVAAGGGSVSIDAMFRRNP